MAKVTQTEFHDYIRYKLGPKAVLSPRGNQLQGESKLAERYKGLWEEYKKGARAPVSTPAKAQTKTQAKSQNINIRKQLAIASAEVLDVSGGTAVRELYQKGTSRYIHYYYADFIKDSSIEKIDFSKLIKIIEEKQIEKITQRTKKAFGGRFGEKYSLYDDDGKVKDAAHLFADAYGIDDKVVRQMLNDMAENINKNDVITGGSQRDWGDSFSSAAGGTWSIDSSVSWSILTRSLDLAADAFNIFADTLDESHEEIQECFSTLCDIDFFEQLINYFRDVLSRDKTVTELYKAINEKRLYGSLDLKKGMSSPGIDKYIRNNIYNKIKTFLIENKMVNINDPDFEKEWQKAKTKLLPILKKYLRITTALDEIENYAKQATSIISSSPQLGPYSKNQIDSSYINENFGYFTRCVAVLSGMMNDVGGRILEEAVARQTVSCFNELVGEIKSVALLTGSGVSDANKVTTYVDENLKEKELAKFSKYNKSNPKSDIVLTMDDHGIRLYFGVTVKAKSDLKDVTISNGKFKTGRDISIKAQQGTPFDNLISDMLFNIKGMAREEALQSTYNEIASHSDMEKGAIDLSEKTMVNQMYLQENFRQFKSALVRYSFVDILTGSGKNMVESAVLLNINGLYFPLFDIVQKIIKLSDESLYKKVEMFLSGSIVGDIGKLNRDSFSSANEVYYSKKNTSKLPSKEEGAIRSLAFFKLISNTKVLTSVHLKDYITGK